MTDNPTQGHSMPTERQPRLLTRFVDARGYLIRIYEEPAAAVKRGLGEGYASYGAYAEEYPPDEAREILKRDLERIQERQDALIR
jgi:hypothetical protein